MTACLLGIDLGSSSIKVSLLEAQSGRLLASAQSPDTEMPIEVPRPGWAEQDPERWWQELRLALSRLRSLVSFQELQFLALGISYQMHGLVCLDRDGSVLRPAIIWCDSRAVQPGAEAFDSLGPDYCLSHCLNSPGNFTASKLAWVRSREPDLFARIHTMLLPGDYLAYRMSGERSTTVTGLSEGILWDFKEGSLARPLLEHFGIPEHIIAPLVPVFGIQGYLQAQAAGELGLPEGIPITYRAGDQPNNAFSLGVLDPGELAATAGTSGVVYGVSEDIRFDERSRVNTFVHVNHQPGRPRNGILMCLNGTGVAYSWLKRHLGMDSYEQMNGLAAQAEAGASGLLFYPFGNGAERILENRHPGAGFRHLDFNRHRQAEVLRSVQEGIVYALNYGMNIMQEAGVSLQCIRAGKANMFLSPLFRDIFVQVSGCRLELFDTDGSQGAARAAGLGAGVYASERACFEGLQLLDSLDPDHRRHQAYQEGYLQWMQGMPLD